MLKRDMEYFHQNFKEADLFLLEAELRQEYFYLLQKKERHSLNEYEEQRLQETSKCPAVSETWFIEHLTNNKINIKQLLKS
jgi:hypothetical protein